jgi:hypothetical protein
VLHEAIPLDNIFRRFEETKYLIFQRAILLEYLDP